MTVFVSLTHISDILGVVFETEVLARVAELVSSAVIITLTLELFALRIQTYLVARTLRISRTR